MMLHAGTLFHDRYRVVRSIQVGGMGAVYEVLDEKTESRRALKVLLPTTLQSADLRARFEREAKITGAIESNHVVHTLDTGLDEATGAPFLVMELLRGEELAAIVARQGLLSADEAMLYLRQAALGLDKVHAAGIVHRDLKLGNLFVVTQDDGTPCLKIIDFGVAKAIAPVAGEANKTRPLGTPLFMAPEQIRGDGRIGFAADIFALGHVTYVLLTGEPYWTEEADEAGSIHGFILAMIQGATEAATVRARRRRGVTLPPAFDVWFARATAMKPEERFSRATEAVAALAEALGVQGGAPGRIPSGAAWPPVQPAPGALNAPSSGVPRLAHSASVSGAAGISTSALIHEAPELHGQLDPRRRRRLVLGGLGAVALLVSLGALLLSSSGPSTPGAAPSSSAASALVAHDPSESAPAATSQEVDTPPLVSASASASASTVPAGKATPTPTPAKPAVQHRPSPSQRHPGID
ncbi:serine/threonine-protein kinase [Chondromyces crocatus]|uniref:Protein kinase n=1 Tax=Chondromyces crocatus TaxID=52 RepID=A0A0K1EI55_CHOCO|nr:serine/threonine-protein kinase [Chondromyces crocatus]AKT40539.1 protein kinase [Chondromyces crocatus]